MDKFADRLKTLRIKKGLTQQQLAEAVGLASKQNISNYENTYRLPGFSLLVSLAKYFNVSTDYLLGIETPEPNPGSIPEMMEAVHDTAISKGWYVKPPTFGEHIALIHSELSEALEEYRNGRSPREVYYEENGKPCGIPIELADTVIRIFGTCAYHKIDLLAAIKEKMAHNATRPVKHGGKVL